MAKKRKNVLDVFEGKYKQNTLSPNRKQQLGNLTLKNIKESWWDRELWLENTRSQLAGYWMDENNKTYKIQTDYQNTILNPKPIVATKENPVVDNNEAYGGNVNKGWKDKTKEEYLDIIGKGTKEWTEDEKISMRRLKGKIAIWESPFSETTDIQHEDLLLPDNVSKLVEELTWKWFNFDAVPNINAIRQELTKKWLKPYQITQVMNKLRTQQNITQVKSEKQESLDESQNIADKETEREISRIREKWERLKQVIQSWYSSRWFGRSSRASESIEEAQKDIDSMVSTAERKYDLERKLRDAQITGISDDQIQSLQNNLEREKSKLAQQLQVNLEKQQKINAETNKSFAESIDEMLNTFEAGTVDTSNADFDKTIQNQSSVILDKNWGIWINPTTWFPQISTFSWKGKKPTMNSMKDANGNMLIYKDWEPDSIVTRDWQYIKWDGQSDLFNLPTTSQEAKTGKWKKWDDGILYNEDTGETKNVW